MEAQIRAAGLKQKDGVILGLTDLIGQIKAAEADAFVDENQQRLENGKTRFTQPNKGGNQGAPLTRNDIMNIKDSAQRQKAIAENLGLFGKGE